MAMIASGNIAFSLSFGLGRVLGGVLGFRLKILEAEVSVFTAYGD